jgi:hypothetical protein
MLFVELIFEPAGGRAARARPWLAAGSQAYATSLSQMRTTVTGTAWKLGRLGQRQFTFLRGCGRELQGGEDLIPVQVRIVDENFLNAAPGCELASGRRGS